MLMEAGQDPRAQPQGIHRPIPDFAEAPVALKTGVHHQGNQILRISHLERASKSLQAINAGEGVEKREPSYTVGGNAN